MEQTFENLQLNRSLVEALKFIEITVPTEIQQKVIPNSKNNCDLIFQSETGTGKTLAYLLPLFEKLDTEKKEMQAIILVPTHELAIQVIRQIEVLTLNSDIKATSTPIIGDVNITRQVDKLRMKPHIIVGTAGRILELIQKKKIAAHTIKTIIIDEADRLLDDNNIEGTKAVIKTTLKDRQIVMCSASMSARVIERANLLMKEPQIIKSTNAIEVPDTIEHLYFVAEQRDKVEVLRKLVRIINPPKAIAFFANADDIAEATEKLQYHKLRADGLHGSNIKSDRKKTMDDFKSGRLQLLIASDIAARGLDIENVTHIFNVSIPERSMDYLHRAGRTGRNGNEGMAISIVTEQEIPFIKQYEKELKITIVPKSMYNGNIVEYKKEKKQRLETESEYAERLINRNYKKKLADDGVEINETGAEKAGEKSASKFNKADRPGKFSKDGGKPTFNRDRRDGDRPAFKRDRKDGDKPAFKRDRKDGDKPAFNRDRKDGDRPAFNRDRKDGDKPAFKRDRKEGDRPAFKRDRKDGDKPAFKRDRKDGDKPAFNRDRKDGDKPAFNRDRKDGDKPAFNRDRKDGDKPAFRRDRKDGDRPAFNRDRKDGDRPAFNRDRKDGGKTDFKRDGADRDGSKSFRGKSGPKSASGEKKWGKSDKGGKTWSKPNSGEKAWGRGEKSDSKKDGWKKDNAAGGDRRQGNPSTGDKSWKKSETGEKSWNKSKSGDKPRRKSSEDKGSWVPKPAPRSKPWDGMSKKGNKKK